MCKVKVDEWKEEDLDCMLQICKVSGGSFRREKIGIFKDVNVYVLGTRRNKFAEIRTQSLQLCL